MKKLLICADASKFTLPKDNFANYVNAFTSLGMEVIISADPEVAASCDALLLPGGEDVNPARYGQEMNGTRGVNEGRDETEFGIIGSFVETKRPIIGICRGEQVLNVYFGGTLIQDIPNHSPVSFNPLKDAVHMVRVEDPMLQKCYGDHFPVNSAHHQVIDKLGKGLKAIAWSDPEGYIEGFRHESLPIFAVQWHPERISFKWLRPDAVDGSKMLGELVKAI